MRISVSLLALLGLMLAALTAWWVIADRAAVPRAGVPSTTVRPDPPPAVVVAPMPSRAEPGAPASAPASSFASFDEDGEPIADPVRNGIALWVSSARGVPAPDLPVTAHWRKGFGLYGRDVGRTDARGRFVTTVAEVEQFEGVEVAEPKLGELGYWADLLPMAEDPRTVQLVVPELAPLRVRVVDARGGPVAGANVSASGGGVSAIPRQHLLVGTVREVGTDPAGAATVLLPEGSYEISAAAAGCTLPQAVSADVGAAGGDATLVLLRDDHRIDVTVRVTPPPGHAPPVKLDAFTRAVPDRAGLPGRGGEGIYRELFVDRQGERTFVVRAEGLAWRCVAKSAGCAAAVVDVPAGQTELRVSLALAAPPPPPKPQLLVTVLDDDGVPTSADLLVHETPDLIYGAKLQCDANGRLATDLPRRRFCISARRSGRAIAVVGPFEPGDADREVTVRLQRELRVSGRVVDATGSGIEAWVRLMRPAGPLRALADGVPEILDTAPTDDLLGTGPDGRFWFGNCSAEPHAIWAFPAGGGLPARKVVAPGTDVAIVPGEGLAGYVTVHGSVHDAGTGAVVADVQLRAVPAITDWRLHSDVDGRFWCVAPPGPIEIVARRRGYAVHAVEIAHADAGTLSLEIRLPPSPLRFLRVLDAAGSPASGAVVEVLDGTGEPIDLLDQHGGHGGTSATVDDAGRVDLRGAPGGSLRVRIRIGDRQQVFAVPATGGLQAAFDLRWTD